MGMMDRKKIIAKLEKDVKKTYAIRTAIFENGEKVGEEITEHREPFVTITIELADKILALLKDQKHNDTFIVIDTKTGKEADEYEIALHEDWAKHLCYCDMEGWAIENDGTLLLVDECGRFAYADRERFKVVWDGEQREGYQGIC